MPQIHSIGLGPGELEWTRLLVKLLRHPDPVVVELSRQALIYVDAVAQRAEDSALRPLKSGNL